MFTFININITFAIILFKLKRKTLNQIQELSIFSKDDQIIADSFKLINDIFLNYIFSKNANYNSNDAKYAMNICIVEQLQTWIRKNFFTILQMITQFRIDRDFAIQIIWDWNIHVENYNSLLKDFEKIEKNKQSNQNIVNIFKRENRIVKKLNIQIFKFKKNNQILQNQMNIFRMNFGDNPIYSSSKIIKLFIRKSMNLQLL